MVNVCVSGIADPLPKCQTNKGHEDFLLFWRPLNSKRSLPVLKCTSGGEYFERYKKYIQEFQVRCHVDSRRFFVTMDLKIPVYPVKEQSL